MRIARLLLDVLPIFMVGQSGLMSGRDAGCANAILKIAGDKVSLLLTWFDAFLGTLMTTILATNVSRTGHVKTTWQWSFREGRLRAFLVQLPL